MRWRILLGILFLFIPALAKGQQQITAGPFSKGGLLYICPVPSGGTPCPSPSSIFSDSGLTQPLSNPLSVPAQTTVTFYANSGQYTLEMPASGVQFIVGSSGGGGGSLPSGGSVGQTVVNTAPGTGTWQNYAFPNLSGSAACGQLPALTGDVTTSAGSCADSIAAAAVTNAKLANSATTVNGQTCTLGSPCNVNAGAATNSVAINQGNGNAETGVAGTITNSIFTANNGAAPSFNPPGVKGSDVNASTYPVACDSATTTIDRATTIRFITTAPTVTIPDPTAAGCGSNFPVTLIASGVTVTVNRTTTAVFNIYNGSTVTTGATTFTLTTGQYATLTSPDNANWLVRVVSGGGTVPINQVVSATGAIATIADGNNPLAINCAQTTDSQDCVSFGETSAATGGTLTNALANQAELHAATASGSTATPLEVEQAGITATTGPPLLQLESLWNNASLVGEGILMNVTNTSSAAGSKLLDLRVGNAAQATVDKAGNAILATSVGTGTPPAVTTGNAFAATEGTSSTGLASTDILDANSTQHAYAVNNNNTGDMPVSRAGCVNVTPVTVSASVTTDQNLMTCTLAANLLNVVGRTLRVWAAGVYSTAATSTAQMTLKVKLCTVSGCGSGTVISPINIQTIALASITVTNNAWNLTGYPTTQTAGASSAYESHGFISIDLGSLTTAADSIFNDINTATVGTIDSTVQLFLQITGAFSAASVSNTFTERQLIVEVLN